MADPACVGQSGVGHEGFEGPDDEVTCPMHFQAVVEYHGDTYELEGSGVSYAQAVARAIRASPLAVLGPAWMARFEEQVRQQWDELAAQWNEELPPLAEPPWPLPEEPE